MRLLALVIPLFIICDSVVAEPIPAPHERTELDEVLEQQRGQQRAPRSGFYRYREPFLDTPSLNDFPRFGMSPVFPRPRTSFYEEEVVPQPQPTMANCGEWEKVHVRRGEVVIRNGCRVVAEYDSSTTQLGDVRVPGWANWYRYCNGHPQFSK